MYILCTYIRFILLTSYPFKILNIITSKKLFSNLLKIVYVFIIKIISSISFLKIS